MIVTIIHMFSVDSSILCFTGMLPIHYMRDIVDELCYYQHIYVIHIYCLSLTIQKSDKTANTRIRSMYVSYNTKYNEHSLCTTSLCKHERSILKQVNT